MLNLKNNKNEPNIERGIQENTERNLDLHKHRQLQTENTMKNISSNINNSQSCIFLDESQEETRKIV